jgi:hypothetical protein
MRVACLIAPQINGPQIDLVPAKLPIVLGSAGSARCLHERHSHNQRQP